MIPKKVKDYLEEYINQEVYVQISLIKGKEKLTIKSAVNRYLKSNHFKDLAEGRPYDQFINSLKDKCLGKLKNSPMLDKKTDDVIIIEIQKKLNNLADKELANTFWEIETGEFLNGDQINELENNRKSLIAKLDISKGNQNADIVNETIVIFCKNYERLCQKKYPEAPLPLEVLKSTGF